MNYEELVQLIQDYLENSDDTFVGDLGQIIRQGELRIYARVRTPDQRYSQSGTVGSQTLIVTGMIEPLGIYLKSGEDYSPLLQKQTSLLWTAYGARTGTPRYYGIQAGDGSTTGTEPGPYGTARDITLILGPRPDTSYDYYIEYIGNPRSITDPNPLNPAIPATTWLSANFGETLLYACLYEAYVYMKGDPTLMGTFKDRYEQGIGEILRSAEGLLHQDEYREIQIAQEVKF